MEERGVKGMAVKGKSGNEGVGRRKMQRWERERERETMRDSEWGRMKREKEKGMTKKMAENGKNEKGEA